MNAFMAIVFSGALLASRVGDVGAQSVPCASSTDGYARGMQAGIAAMVSDTSADNAGWRADAHLPLTSASAVTFVTSDSICTGGARRTSQMQASVPCGPSTDEYAQAMLDGAIALASDTSADGVDWRADAHLPLTQASGIALVTSDSVCTAAAKALALLKPTIPLHAVWIIAIGPTRYVVFDKERVSAHRRLAAIYDTAFTWLGDILA